MKRISFLFICIISSCVVWGQTTVSNLSIEDSVRVKFSNDTASYNQFLIFGKCKCADLIDTTASYSVVYDELFAQWTPLARILGNGEGGKKKLETYLDTYIRSKMQTEITFLDFHDDVVRNHHHTVIVCERIFSSQKNWSVYQDFIRQDGIFMGMEHYLREYLLSNSEVISNQGW